MEQIPEFWRTEVFHPLSVHFPIALLVVATLFRLVALKSSRDVWDSGASILLFLGVTGLWVAIYTGNLADGIVSRKICDPTILKDHENIAWFTGWLFTTAFVLDVLRRIKPSIFTKSWFAGLLAVTLTCGTGALLYTGHLGATLVYQQAAGVYVPSPDCIEFEE